MKEVKAAFHCTQDELYAAVALILKNYFEELPSFTGLKPKYTEAYGVALENELKVVELMPGKERRVGERGLEREYLLQKLAICLDKMVMLKLFIKDAYSDAAIRRLKMKIAGFEDYTEAKAKNWEKVSAMLVAARVFIADNELELLANDNMPVGFRAEFNGLVGEILEAITEWLNYKENVRQAAAEKIKLSNRLYLKIIYLCADGVVLMKDDGAKKVQFVFKNVLELITPKGASSLRVKVAMALDGSSVLDATVRLQQLGKVDREVKTDAKGAYFESVAAGVYMVVVEIDGVVRAEISKKVVRGVDAKIGVLIEN